MIAPQFCGAYKTVILVALSPGYIGLGIATNHSH